MSRAQFSFRPTWLVPLLLLSVPLSVKTPGLLAHTELIAPNGGETLTAGQVFPIEWTVAVPHDLENWDLWYSTTGDNGPWIDIAMNLDAGNPDQGSLHFFDWTVPNLSADQAWVRVRMDNASDDYFDVSDLAFSIVTANAVCDFTDNGQCDVEDLNALLAEGPIAGGVAVVPGDNDQYDLDGNGTLNLADLDQWRTLAAAENGLASPYKLGDANLDGVVDGSDFIDWNAWKFAATLRWDHGNFNGDAVTDGSDFILWNAEKFQSSAAVTSLPEPHGGLLCGQLLCLAAFAAARSQALGLHGRGGSASAFA